MYLSQGKEIRDMRAWLLTVMNRKFYDMLRKKYRQPTAAMATGLAAMLFATIREAIILIIEK